jgi:DNA end-binding protein Ku
MHNKPEIVMAVRAYWKGSYQEALKTLVKRKAAGKPVKLAEREEEPDNVISLMDALRQSLKRKASAKRSTHSPARRATPRPAKKAHRSAARARKAS